MFEILYILSARPVAHHIADVNISNEFYSIFMGDDVLSEELPGLLKYRIVCDCIFALLGRKNTVRHLRRFRFSAFLCGLNDVGVL